MSLIPFIPARTRDTGPARVSVSKRGAVLLLAKAVRDFRLSRFTHASYLYDPSDSSVFAIQFLTANRAGANKIFEAKDIPAISAQRFIKAAGIAAGRYLVDWDEFNRVLTCKRSA